MADLSITAGSVVASSGATIVQGTAGASITAGQPLYMDSSDSNKLKLADANASSATATVVGISLHAAGSGQPISYITAGSYTVGASLTAGLVYVCSSAAGMIAPSADLAQGWRTSILFVATSTTVGRLVLYNSDTALA